MPSQLLISAILAAAFYQASSKPIPPPIELVARHFEKRDASNPYVNWPSYDQLPLHPSYPTKAAWGVWGSNDTQGSLNHITNSTITHAAQTGVLTGQTFNLNLELDEPNPPINPNRRPLSHLYQPGDGYIDDVLVLNTQVSTQYDGLRHFPYSTNNSIDTYQWYNDLINDLDAVVGPSPTTVLGIQQSAQKGIAGRGILLDWAGWKDSLNQTFDAFSSQNVTVSDLDKVAAWQGLNVSAGYTLPGDILLVRTGWLRQYQALSAHDQNVLPYGDGNSVGLQASEDTLSWVWEKKLALIGTDNPAVESLPFNATIAGVPRSLHEIFIGGWGQSIIEFMDLEALAVALHKSKRSTFFITIQTLNVISGIASPPNALAIM